MIQNTTLLGVSITNEKADKILEYVVSRVKSGSEKLFIITPNPEIIVYAQAHPDYKAKLNTAEIALPDGIGVLLGGWILGKPFKERITGVDFIEMLCQKSSEKPMSMGFLGGKDGVAEKAAHRLQKKYPWIKVSFIGEEWGLSKSDALRYSKDIDILFVAFGAPKQEEWIYENLSHLPVKVAMGVGGAFDYLSGQVIRAPKFIRSLGLEWLFRLVRQPWRFKRQLSLITFIFLIVKDLTKKEKLI